MTRKGGRGLLAQNLKRKIEKIFENLQEKTMFFLWQHAQELRVSALEIQGCQLAQVVSRVPAMESKLELLLGHSEAEPAPEPTPPVDEMNGRKKRKIEGAAARTPLQRMQDLEEMWHAGYIDRTVYEQKRDEIMHSL